MHLWLHVHSSGPVRGCLAHDKGLQHQLPEDAGHSGARALGGRDFAALMGKRGIYHHTCVRHPGRLSTCYSLGLSESGSSVQACRLGRQVLLAC